MTKTRKRFLNKDIDLGAVVLVPEWEETSKPKPKPKPVIDRDYKRLDKHLEKIRIHAAGMRQAFIDYCNDAHEMGFTGRETWDYMYSKLKDIIPKSTLYDWGNKYLPSGTMKVTKPIGNIKKDSNPESLESERSLPQKQLQEQKGSLGRINQAPDEYEIEHLLEYDIEYLREIVRWYDKNKEDLLKEAFKWQAKFDEMKATRRIHEAEIGALRNENAELKKKLGLAV